MQWAGGDITQGQRRSRRSARSCTRSTDATREADLQAACRSGFCALSAPRDVGILRRSSACALIRRYSRGTARAFHERGSRMTTTLLVNIDVDDLHKAHRLLLQGVRPDGRPALRRGRRRAARRDPRRSICSSSRTARSPPRPAVTCARTRGTGRRCTWISSSTKSTARSIARATPARGSKARSRRNNWGKIAMLADPFGHGICLIEFVGRATTRSRPTNRQSSGTRSGARN